MNELTRQGQQWGDYGDQFADAMAIRETFERMTDDLVAMDDREPWFHVDQCWCQLWQMLKDLASESMPDELYPDEPGLVVEWCCVHEAPERLQ